MKKLFILTLFIAFGVALKTAEPLLFPVPVNWPLPQYDFAANPLSEAKVTLGRALFYDPILSRDSTISCESCHSPYTAFTHADHALSHGINNKTGTRNAPALMNLAWSQSFMWDGAIRHLDMQALAPISHPDEMGETLDHVIVKLQNTSKYRLLYYRAFGDSSITGEHTLKAIAQFLLTLVSANSKYDSVMRRQSHFSQQEQQGYILFKKNCSTCHTEPFFTNHEFSNNGLPIDTVLNDWGRFRITGNRKDSLLFKVPSLRNIQFTGPYMHDGRFERLQDVIKYYAQGIVHSSHLPPQLKRPIVLSANDKVDLLAFLLTLTDKHFLFNPDFGYPREIYFNEPKEK